MGIYEDMDNERVFWHRLGTGSKMNAPKCHYCNGTGKLRYQEDKVELTYGKHIINKDWKKHDNVFIWFEALKKPKKWSGVAGYVYETSSGEYIAPFCGELVKVVKDTRNEFRECTND